MVMITQIKTQISKNIHHHALRRQKKIARSISNIHTMEKPSTIEQIGKCLHHAMTSTQLKIKDQNNGSDEGSNDGANDPLVPAHPS